MNLHLSFEVFVIRPLMFALFAQDAPLRIVYGVPIQNAPSKAIEAICLVYMLWQSRARQRTCIPLYLALFGREAVTRQEARVEPAETGRLHHRVTLPLLAFTARLPSSRVCNLQNIVL